VSSFAGSAERLLTRVAIVLTAALVIAELTSAVAAGHTLDA